ncbi:DUF4143 domain-containing protein [Bifidobacterium vespertilionis]|uniref:DUF4143 domain-containing protein n=2 Tax=Bifidobacterium vespertilionis TaxID=2562524 RepID=UPI0037C071FC
MRCAPRSAPMSTCPRSSCSLRTSDCWAHWRTSLPRPSSTGIDCSPNSRGALTEQYVCQQLIVQGYEPAYWANPKGHAEIDFAIEMDGIMRAIEVKDDQNLRAKSLRYAHDHFGLERALRLSLSGYGEKDWLINIPLWAASGLRAYLRNQ